MQPAIQQALLDWNPWREGAFPEALLGFARDYHLLDYLNAPEIKIIEGARRVGKSTLMYQVIRTVLQTSPNVLYVNFEDEILKKYSLGDIVYAFKEKEKLDYLFVDEIQNCIDWVTFVRKIYDRREIQQIWISGSNSTFIKQEYATLLTGRNLPITISPLSFHEFLHFNSFHLKKLSMSKNQKTRLIQLFSDYMEYGSFPAVANRSVLKKELLLSYFSDFIYKDIVGRYNVDAEKIKELALFLATNSTKSFSYRNMSNVLNCHVNTVMDYITHLKSIFMFEELYKFDFSLKKQLVTDKKIYCLDTGIASAISFRFSEDKGRILENIVFSELKRRQKKIFFHKHKFECDFIVKTELKISEAIQVCFSLVTESTKAREMNGLLEALNIHQLKRGLILTYDEEGVEEISDPSGSYTVIIQPVWRWLLTHYLEPMDHRPLSKLCRG